MRGSPDYFTKDESSGSVKEEQCREGGAQYYCRILMLAASIRSIPWVLETSKSA